MNNYVIIKVIGKKPILFINKLLRLNIYYDKYNVLSNDEISLKVSYEDYLKIINLKTIYEIKVLKYIGPIKYKMFIKNNKHVVIGIILCIINVMLLSNITFDISVIHNDKKIRTLILESLKKEGIATFRFTPNYEKRKYVKEKIIKENKDNIEWLEIDKKGSKLIVKVTERKVNKKIKEIHTRHIIAKKEGIIKKIVAQDGVILKKKDDYVNKGDIIVSGDIIKDETVKGQVVANGVVYAEVWYNVHVSYPLYYKEIKYLPEVKNNVIVTLLNKKISLRSNYKSMKQEKINKIIFDKPGLFSLYIEKQRKTKTVKQKLSKQKALNKASKLAEKKINKLLNKDEYIISKNTLNFNSNSSKIEVDVFFKVYENITDYKNTDDIIENKEE